MAGQVAQPHDHLFREVFGKETEAAGLLQAHLPQAISNALVWSSLKWQSVSFIDDRLRDSESDLLYAIRRKESGAPAWIYVLLEHQSTPDPWLRLRLLKYSCRIWERDRARLPKEEQLRPIVPLVWYQGERGWHHAREFSELFAEDVRSWPGVPRYAHLLIDQSALGPEEVHGALHGRIAQLAMMAAYRASWPVLRRLVPLLAQLEHVGRIEDLRQIVVYIAVTTRDADDWRRFATAVRREVPTIGGELMNQAEEMMEVAMKYLAHRTRQEAREEGLQAGLQEGRQEGRQEAQVEIVENFLEAGVPWSTIEAATGMDQDKLRTLKRRMKDATNGATRAD